MKKKANQLYAKFAHAYIAKGENATEAYLAVKPNVQRNTAGAEGHRLLKIPEVHKLIEQLRAELRARYALTTDRVIQELARVAYFNPAQLVGKKLKDLHEDVTAPLTLELDGKGNVLKIRTPPPSAKNTAVKQAVKILRLEDKPPPPPPDPDGHQVLNADPRDTARRMLFLLRKGAVEERQAPAAPKQAKKKAPAAA